MRNKNLRISKSIIPLDWNPENPSSYNEWMQMIVQENLKTEGIAIIPHPSNFITPTPKHISEIFHEGLSDSIKGMQNTLEEANKILKGD